MAEVGGLIVPGSNNPRGRHISRMTENYSDTAAAAEDDDDGEK